MYMMADQQQSASPCAKLCYAHYVEMHNVFKISAASTKSVILSASLRTTREILKTLCISTD
ncbi:hypothetical protein D6D20_02309 [Aureobasidium pullulans]|uniref:Uncharacterized protein n=1 Tax=Aureobasidium pullulans TaxID=5580 RepID=A0A4S8ZGY3_AURPU|nr:hypothetical protein D6D20_02309 [Aureobasidium pullulans]